VARAEAGLSAIEAASNVGGPTGEAMEAHSGPEEAVGEEGFKPSVRKLAANFSQSSNSVFLSLYQTGIYPIIIYENCTVARKAYN
jgi:hypothetical protein